MLTSVGALVLILAAAVLAFRPRWFVWLLAATAAFPATAVLSVGGSSIPPFFVLGIVATPLAVVTYIRRPGPRIRATRLLVWLLVWSVFVSLLGPYAFSGMKVLIPRGGIDEQIVNPGDLAYSVSMLAQLLYLALGIGTAHFIARSKSTGPRLAEACFTVGLGLSSASVLAGRVGILWPDSFFRNYATAAFNPFDTRAHGVFPEASYLAVFATAAAAYYVLRLATVTTVRGRANAIVWIGLAVLCLASARSGTGTLTFLVLCLGLVVLAVSRWLLLRGRLPAWAPTAILVSTALSLVSARLTDTVISVIHDKAVSESAVNRLGSDRFSLRIFLDSHWLGVGLGANRPSSMLTMLLSCVGIVGLLLFVAAMAQLLGTAFKAPGMTPIAWTLLTLLVAKAISESALSTPLLWLLIGICMSVKKTHLDPPMRVSNATAGTIRLPHLTDSPPLVRSL